LPGGGGGAVVSSVGVITSSVQETIAIELDRATRRIRRIFFITILFDVYRLQSFADLLDHLK
jgi:hypothetical protein